MTKHVLLYILLAVLFLPPLLLFIPIGSIIVLLFIPLILYFVSLEVIEKAMDRLFSYSFGEGEKENQKENTEEVTEEAMESTGVSKWSPRINPYVLILVFIVSIAIIIRWDGWVLALTNIAFILLSGFGGYIRRKPKK
ncbi:hypothetical protein CACET_c08310 [Clostridium aceticum]|uniref:Uncharacterized protein n=1 Tax=Clostridium aceticum TaxID=84022 RepID=A0A0D8I865_9CLOT|nr:hypothetical protein [Clostridium aceticum]AKL94340.1 hypothetical protein CACET_c08310 [Clostridium aceticum]KJF25411.1 hypothetical protein TZ02_18815 [Clostridium aceticum]